MIERYDGEIRDGVFVMGTVLAGLILWGTFWVVPYNNHLESMTACAQDLGGLTEAHWAECLEAKRETVIRRD